MTMKKKLLFINGHLNAGGVEKALVEVLQNLDYEKYDVDLLLTENLGDYADQLPPQVHVLLRSIEGTYGPLAGVLLNNIRSRDWFSLKIRLIFLTMKLFGQKWVVLAKNLLTEGTYYDCVIGFRAGFCTQIAAYAVNADRRITWWHHGEINVEPNTYLETAMRCDKVAVVSDACREMLADAFPLLKDRLVTVHNILDAETVRQKANAFHPYTEKDKLHIVSVGGLVPEKHFDNAIYTAAALKGRGIAFKWHLVGDGILHNELREKAKMADVTDCFVFEGNQVNPYPYMKYADLFVHPSYVESFGIVVTEALALGTPCVVTKSTGVQEFLRDGENALLTEQDPQNLAEKVVQILEDRELYNRIKENTQCPKQFLPKVVGKKIECLLEDQHRGEAKQD